MRNKIIGIYEIRNKIDGKRYIGMSRDLETRLKDHKRALKGEYHHCSHLQRAYLKYGEENFEFKIIMICQDSIVEEMEVYYIKKYNSSHGDYGYNLTAGGKGKNKAKHLLDAISNAHRGKKEKNATCPEYVGVRFKDNGWEAWFKYPGGKQTYIGRFCSPKMAALAYDKESLRTVGKTFNFDEEYVRNTELDVAQYSSSFIGVSKRKDSGNFRARIMVDKKSINLGCFEKEIDAAQTYDWNAIKYFGEKAKLNFPENRNGYVYLVENNIPVTKIQEIG